MKLKHLVEAPLADYKHLGDTSITPKELTNNQTINKLKKWFNNIGYDIYAYTIKSEKKEQGIPSLLDKISDAKYGEIEYYKKIPYNVLKKILGDEVNKIKTNNNAITIIFVYDENNLEFNITPWGMVHDFVHSLEMGGSYGKTLIKPILNDLDKELTKLAKKHKVYDDDDFNYFEFLDNFGTTKAARTGQFRERPEEFLTDVFTQWIVTGDVKFNTPKFIENKEEFEQDKERFKQLCIKAFRTTVDEATGGIYLTTL